MFGPAPIRIASPEGDMLGGFSQIEMLMAFGTVDLLRIGGDLKSVLRSRRSPVRERYNTMSVNS